MLKISLLTRLFDKLTPLIFIIKDNKVNYSNSNDRLSKPFFNCLINVFTNYIFHFIIKNNSIILSIRFQNIGN